MKKKLLIGTGVLVLLLAAFLGYRYLGASKQKQAVDPQILKIKERGKLIVGADIPYGVMELLDESGNAIGVDVDIAKEIAANLGVQFEFKDYDWDFLFPAVKSGEIDLAISAITTTEERQKEMLFSIPYFNGGQAMVTKSENNNISSINDMADKKVGVQIDTTGNEFVKKYVSEKSIFTYKNTAKMIDAINAGKIDLFIVDYIEAISTVKQNPSLKIIGEPFTQEFYGIVTKLGNDGLIGEINETLREMKRSGKLDEIKAKWLK